jgi:SAM-dependent methyltransferase
LTAAVEIWKRIQAQGYTPVGNVFFEVGTGRVPLVPLAYWLMGAEKTITIDLNPYLKRDLVAESLRYIFENEEEVRNLFGSLLDQKRFVELSAFNREFRFSISAFLNLCRVDYVAPGDAANTRLPNQSIDFHTSYTVFEHIPSDILRRILEEGNRIIRNGGLFVHRIDYSDHFSHSDKSISAINFLTHSDDEWKRYAGNRYMYMNRLRHDDFINLFEGVGHTIVQAQPSVDQRSRELLRNGSLKLNRRFSSKSEDVLAMTGAWIISRKNSSQALCALAL